MLFLQDQGLKLSQNVVEQTSCEVVRSFNFSQRCSFVTTVQDCLQRKNYVNYIQFMYCTLNADSELLEMIYTIGLLLYCWIFIVILGTVVFYIFLPALKVMAVTWGMNEHLAGATLMAFGDSTTDVLACLANIMNGQNQDDSIYSDVISGVLYVAVFISGVIIVLAPFEMHASTGIRDVSFLLFAILYIDFAMRSNECVSFRESIIILSIYFIYLTVLIIDQVILKLEVKELQRRYSESSGSESDLTLLEKMREEADFEVYANTSRETHATRATRMVIDIKQNRKSMYRPRAKKNENLFQQFFESINPLDIDEFEDSSNFKKVILIFRVPINLIFFTIIPIVNYELPRHGWSKLLNCIQIVVMPLIASLIIWNTKTVYFIPIWSMSLIITVPIAILFFVYSRTDISPPGHVFLAFLASIGSSVVLYNCAFEVMEIFFVVGVVFNSSQDFLNVTIIAWGMAIGDIVSNVSLALNGYPRMGYAACFGSSMFNCIFIIGGYFLYTCITEEQECVHVTRGSVDENICCFLVLSLLFTLIWLLLLQKQARRCVGYFSIGMYIFFCIYTLCGELSILHSYAHDVQFFPIL